MAEKKKKEPEKVGSYTLTSTRKLRNAQAKFPNDEEAQLVEYDRRLGAFFKDGTKVENGLFWDFEKDKPRTTSEKKTTKKT